MSVLTENTLLNIVQIWAEEALDCAKCFKGALVIRTHQDGPEPMQARIEAIPTDGSSLFVTIDLTSDMAQNEWPIYSDPVKCGDELQQERSMLREVVFSISAYRCDGVDAARYLVNHVRGRSTHATFFTPHRVAFKQASDVNILNEIILEQWERRAQFTLTLHYVDTMLECQPIMLEPCIPACEGDCFEEAEKAD